MVEEVTNCPTLWQVKPKKLEYDDPLWHYGTGSFSPIIPNIECESCGPGAGGPFSVASSPCPPQIAREIESVYASSPTLDGHTFRKHMKRWRDWMEVLGFAMDLAPGTIFPPFKWQLPTQPSYSLFWPSLEIVVDEDIASRLIDKQVRGVTFHPIHLDRVGLLDANSPPPHELIASCSEPEDIIELAPYRDVQSSDKYFSLLISERLPTLAQFKRELGTIECPICGRHETPRSEQIRWNKERSHYRKKRELPAKYTSSNDVFLSDVFNEGFLLSPAAFSSIKNSSLANCDVVKINIIHE